MNGFQLGFEPERRRPLRVLAILLAAFALRGQTPHGEIRVQIKDPSGAIMAASGELESLPLGVQRSFQTNAQGSYTLGNLPYGHYRLEISAPGFATQSVWIDVHSQIPVARTITPALGPETSKVDVVPRRRVPEPTFRLTKSRRRFRPRPRPISKIAAHSNWAIS